MDRLGEWGTATFSESNLHICVHNPVEFLKTIREEIAGLSPILAHLVETAVLTGKSQTYETNKQLFWELSDFISNIERKLRVGLWDHDVIGMIGFQDAVVELLKLFAGGAREGHYHVVEVDFEQHPWAWSGIVDGVATDIDGATLIHVNFVDENTGRTFKLIEGLTDAQKLLGVFDLNEALSPQFAWYNFIRPGFPLPIVLTHYDALIAQDKARADAVVQDYETKIRAFFHEQGLGVTVFYLTCPGASGDFANFNEVVITLILNIASCPPVSDMPEIPYKLPFEYLERKISASLARPSHEHIDPNQLCWTDRDVRMVTGALKYHMHRRGVKLCPKCGMLVEGGERCPDGTPVKRATAIELVGNFYLHAMRKMHSLREALRVPEFEEVVGTLISEDMRAIRLEDLQTTEEEIYGELAARTAARIGKVLDEIVYTIFPRKITPATRKSPPPEIDCLDEKTYVVIPQVIPAPEGSSTNGAGIWAKNLIPGSYAYKVVLEDQTAGRESALLEPFVEGKFDTDYKSTIGTSIMKKELIIPGSAAKVRFIIWDLAMPAEFKRVRQTYFQNAEAGIVIFDVTRRETFKTVEKCITEARRGSGKPDLPVILVGTNASEPGREVSHEEAASLGEALGLHYVESAGVPRDWVNDIFDWLARIFVQRAPIS